MIPFLNWATAVVAAPRPIPCLHRCLQYLRTNHLPDPIVFAEPGLQFTTDELGLCETVRRPELQSDPIPFLEVSPEGRHGNFQNWLQAGADLLEMRPDADVYLIVEDDAILCEGAVGFADQFLWPSARCGAVSLYSAACNELMRHRTPNLVPFNRRGMLGALAMAFRRECLESLVRSPEIQHWQGMMSQRGKYPPRWQLAGVDTWIGNRMHDANWQIWCFSRSLVNHWVPLNAKGRQNSTMNNGPNVGRRCPLRYVGDRPGDLGVIFKAINLEPVE